MRIATVHPLGSLGSYKYVVVMARYKGNLLLCRKKGMTHGKHREDI